MKLVPFANLWSRKYRCVYVTECCIDSTQDNRVVRSVSIELVLMFHDSRSGKFKSFLKLMELKWSHTSGSNQNYSSRKKDKNFLSSVDYRHLKKVTATYT